MHVTMSLVDGLLEKERLSPHLQRAPNLFLYLRTDARKRSLHVTRTEDRRSKIRINLNGVQPRSVEDGILQCIRKTGTRAFTSTLDNGYLQPNNIRDAHTEGLGFGNASGGTPR